MLLIAMLVALARLVIINILLIITIVMLLLWLLLTLLVLIMIWMLVMGIRFMNVMMIILHQMVLTVTAPRRMPIEWVTRYWAEVRVVRHELAGRRESVVLRVLQFVMVALRCCQRHVCLILGHHGVIFRCDMWVRCDR